MHPSDFVLLNGAVVPLSQGSVSLMSPAFRYGATVFEGIKAYWSEERQDLLLFRLDAHLQRMRESMRIMRFGDAPSPEEMCAGIARLIRHNAPRQTCHVRLYAFIDGDAGMWATGPVSWAVTLVPTPRLERVESGISCGISSWQRIGDNVMPPRAKVTANYNNGRLAGIQGQLDGYDNVLMLTQSGHVSETPGSCFFMVRHGAPITPAVTDSILESITRDTVLTLLRETLSLTTAERPIDRTETYCAEEAFLCGSAQEITPVTSIDRHVLGDGTPGPITQAVQTAYFDAVLGRNPRHAGWVTAAAAMGGPAAP
jgi:branched-chain amino acid aminotransferase